MRRIHINYSNITSIINILRNITNDLEEEKLKVKSALNEINDLENYYTNKINVITELESCEKHIRIDIQETEIIIQNLSNFLEHVMEVDERLASKIDTYENDLANKNKLALVAYIESITNSSLAKFISDGTPDALVGLVYGFRNPAYIQGLDGRYRIVGDLNQRLKVGINAKGATYKIGSQSFIDAGLDKYLPRGSSPLEYVKKFFSNADDAIKNSSSMKKIFMTNIKDNVLDLTEDALTFKQNTSGSYKTFGNAATALGHISIVADAIDGIHKNISTGESTTDIVSDVIVDVSAGIGSMAIGTGCAKVGAAIGTLIPIPGVGTAVGAVAGFALGMVGSNIFNNVVDDDAKDKIGDTVSDFFDGVGNALGFIN